MTSNYPPGVTESMIPGCRPEDHLWEKFYEKIDRDTAKHGIYPEDAYKIWKMGMKDFQIRKRGTK